VTLFRWCLNRTVWCASQEGASPHSKYASSLVASRVILKFCTDACAKLGIKPTITVIIVGKRHRVRFFPCSKREGDQRSGNCLTGTVVDSDVVDPVEFDFYLLSHGGMHGTSRPTHYNVLIDENNFTCVAFSRRIFVGADNARRADDLQSVTYALCHVDARATRSVAIPAPLGCDTCSLCS
jgi:eukaryotic translation initiation factor 2C